MMKNLEKEAMAYSTLKEITKIIKLAEKDIKEINSEFSIENTIKVDLSVSKRSMAYNKIKAEVKKFRNKIKEMEEK